MEKKKKRAGEEKQKEECEMEGEREVGELRCE
jgi:hypothetical protein